MSKSQRSKGQRGERELFARLSEELGETVRRNVDQAREGGADSLEVKGFAVEVKRHERLSRPKWWAQAVKQAKEVRREPILFYRRSREPWRALIHTIDGGYREATLEQAVYHIREKWACWP